MTEHLLAGTTPPEPGHAIRVSVEGREIAIFNLGARLAATDARCTHVGGPLERGPLRGVQVTCPLHGSVFDVETGAVVRGPARSPLRTYRVRADPAGLRLDIEG